MKTRDLTISSDIAELHGALAALAQFCRETSVDGEACRLMSLALDEMLVNVMRYAYENGGEICIGFRSEEERLVVEVADRGRPFDPTGADSPDLDSMADEGVERGRGIFLARQCVDEFDYHYADGVNRLTLVKQTSG